MSNANTKSLVVEFKKEVAKMREREGQLTSETSINARICRTAEIQLEGETLIARH